MQSTLSEAEYAKKKAKMESKAALYVRATFIAICSKRQVSSLTVTAKLFRLSALIHLVKFLVNSKLTRAHLIMLARLP